ncbi:MAG: sulfoxide reductase heme-binding subunit YedZ [Pyrinomonadaceae bacterium MAG19_C2-C3]|nr:sulfoxide reductase heme-binding subunit YedZ [Pyrinomonadaceae bacterium MAG19_C2-C3]
MALKDFKLKDEKFARTLVFINCLVPAILLVTDFARGRLGANPLDFMTEATGTLALIFLLLSLSVTPLRRLTELNWLIKFRRLIGLYAFFYLSLHFLTYIWFDKFFNFAEIATDAMRRPFILVGFTAFILMMPLAVTSTNNMVKRLGGKNWNRLHKLAYLCAILGVTHYFLLVKSDITKPLAYATLLAALLGYRIYIAYFPPTKGNIISAPSPIPRR